jgi:hypothetical protein
MSVITSETIFRFSPFGRTLVYNDSVARVMCDCVVCVSFRACLFSAGG